VTIRPAIPADEGQVAAICLLTGADGGDATGLFADDSVLADVYAVPYLYGPECIALAWDVDGEARGYVVGTANTRAFQEWFVEVCWPMRPVREPRTAGDEWLIPGAADPNRMLGPIAQEYPAHLHIDLLPDQQGKGAGRQLIEAFCVAAADAGARGVHLEASSGNRAAMAFYPKVGFEAVATTATTVTFARRL